MVEIIFEIAPLQTLILVVISFNAPRPCFQVRLSVYPRQLFSACKQNQNSKPKDDKRKFPTCRLCRKFSSNMSSCLYSLEGLVQATPGTPFNVLNHIKYILQCLNST